MPKTFWIVRTAQINECTKRYASNSNNIQISEIFLNTMVNDFTSVQNRFSNIWNISAISSYKFKKSSANFCPGYYTYCF